MDENSFYSVDRLVEFGLGMAMAQQMVQMMNQTMQSMYVPGSILSMPQKPAHQTASSSLVCYVGIDGKQVGPLNEAELAKLVANKHINKDTYAWIPGMPAWKAISEIPEILRIIALTPPPIPSNL